VASALAVERAGAAAVATSSSAVAGARGYPDGEQIPVDELFALLGQMAVALQVPLSADVESGFGLSAEALVVRLLDAGAVGMNLEDTDRAGGATSLIPVDDQASRIGDIRAAAAAAGVEIVINARIDSFLRGSGEPEERLRDAIGRARAYRQAGADCVFPIWLTDADAIGQFVSAVDAPVNILLRPGSPGVAELVWLGVRRISVGGGLSRLAVGNVEEAARQLIAGDGSAFAEVGET
jgi:2-methylisocitrate lyase-like PEP mutase family enzyme